MISPKIRNHSKGLVYEFTKNKKYIPNIFVEIGDTCEKLRYTVGGRVYLTRIRKELQSLFLNDEKWFSEYWRICHDGAKPVVPRSRVKLLAFIEDIEKVADERFSCDVFEKKKDEFSELTKKKDKYFYRISKLMGVRLLVSKLKRYLVLNLAKDILLTSTAGNGKSTILTYTVDSLIKAGHPVFFMNSRLLGDHPLEYILNNILYSESKPRHFIKGLLWIFGFWYKLWGIPVVIIIDAINENDSNSFKKDLIDLLSFFTELPNYKVIMSCREEYLKLRFHYLLEKLCIVDAGNNFGYDNQKLSCRFSINTYMNDTWKRSSPYLRKLITRYQCYYKKERLLAPFEYEKLIDTSLLLFRFYFESMENGKTINGTITRYSIFRKYIENVESPNFCTIDLLLETVGQIMYEKKNFDHIEIKELVDRFSESGVDRGNLFMYLDESLLLYHSLIEKEGTLLESSTDIIRFTFDELRDYILSRVLLKLNKTISSDTICTIINQYFIEDPDNPASCTEGVITYLYAHFRLINEKKLAASIFKNFIIKLPDRGNYRKLLVMKVFTENGMPFTDYEKSYIKIRMCDDINFAQSLCHMAFMNSYSYHPSISEWFSLIIESRKEDNRYIRKAALSIFIDQSERLDELFEGEIVGRIVNLYNNRFYSFGAISVLVDLLAYEILNDEVILEECKKLPFDKLETEIQEEFFSIESERLAFCRIKDLRRGSYAK